MHVKHAYFYTLFHCSDCTLVLFATRPTIKLLSEVKADLRKDTGGREPTCQETFLDPIDTRVSFVVLGDAVPVRDRDPVADC